MDDYIFSTLPSNRESFLWLQHYGTKYHSGRYPYGSGEDPYQHDGGFLGCVRKYREEGKDETEIAHILGMSTTEYRKRLSVANSMEKISNMNQAQRLKDKGYSQSEIARIMNVNESTIRGWLNESAQERARQATETADALSAMVNENHYIDIGPGTAQLLGIKDTKLDTAVMMLQEQGYEVHNIMVQQMGTKNKTTMSVLVPPGVTIQELYSNKDKIYPVNMTSIDNGDNYVKTPPVKSVSSERVSIVYAEEGGTDRDGVMYIRPGCSDLDLGEARYAQVRIAVDDTHYLKGIAMYGKEEDFPEGTDIIFNTNKKEGTPKLEVLKKMKSDDPDNPFQSAIYPKLYLDENGNVERSALNIVREEGEWGEWSKSLASQMLSKQPLSLAKEQLNKAYAEKEEEYNTIMSLTNPTIRKYFLSEYADQLDSDAVTLKAAAMPRQASQVILPCPSLKDNEIYAPNFRDGETVVLIRYPHGGRFEIPQLTVNNKNQEGHDYIGDAKDAVGINPHVANQLSGADFDGDTVLVIPNNSGKIKVSKPLSDLAKFDSKSYALKKEVRDGKELYFNKDGKEVKPMTEAYKQKQMGIVSNLITDMTLQGASEEELARAVKHSMVVIDAAKHKLDYKQSEYDNGISELQAKYQNNGEDKKPGGAHTLISKAKSEERVPERKGWDQRQYQINPDTGEKIWIETGRNYTQTKVNKKTGEVSEKIIFAESQSTKMYEAKNARELSSGTDMEELYASYANKCKALANQCRKDYISTEEIKYNPEAAKEYSNEVASLKAKLNVAKKNAPLERQAQLRANIIIEEKIKANPELKDDKEHLKKEKGRALNKAREETGAKKQRIVITEKEYEAIQKGAVSSNILTQIINNSDDDSLRQWAMPKESKTVWNDSMQAKAETLHDRGYTWAQIADSLGVSATTVRDHVT